MEIPSSKNNTIAFPLLALIHVLMIYFSTWINSIEKFFSIYVFDYSKVNNFEEKRSQIPVQKKPEGEIIIRDDVEIVMGKLGLGCNPGSEDRLKEIIGFDSISNLFEEEEASLEEVKEAFDVFDVNKDGFIDEEEVHIVLSILGFKEGRELGNCRKMIKSVDGNGDGRIDFHEFVSLMENSSC